MLSARWYGDRRFDWDRSSTWAERSPSLDLIVMILGEILYRIETLLAGAWLLSLVWWACLSRRGGMDPTYMRATSKVERR